MRQNPLEKPEPISLLRSATSEADAVAPLAAVPADESAAEKAGDGAQASEDEAETPATLGAREADPLELEADLRLPPPTTPAKDAQPLGVYLQWWVASVVLGTLALRRPLDEIPQLLSAYFPDGTQVATFGALATLALAAIERSKRDRTVLGALLTALTALLIVLAVGAPRTLAGAGTPAMWLIAMGTFAVAALHLLCIEDWIAGRAGPRTQQLVATLGDIATAPWFAWSSKVARLRRAREQTRQSELSHARATEAAVRQRAEDEAATAAAERSAAADRLASAQLAEEASTTERRATLERSRADEAATEAAEAKKARALAESKVAAARQRAEELGRAADSAALARTQLRRDQLEAARRVLETAMSAKTIAERALSQAVEAERARELLDAALAELASDDGTEPGVTDPPSGS